MRIGVSGQLLKGRYTGVEHYVYNLMRNIVRYNVGNEYVFYVPRVFSRTDAPIDGLRIRESWIPGTSRAMRFLWEQSYLPILLAKDNIDVFHAPGYTMPLMTTTPSVVTIHDVIAMKYPEFCSRMNRLHYRLVLPPTAAKAARIITTTGYTRDDIVDTLGVPEDKIDVIPLGVHESFVPIEDGSALASVRRRYGLPPEFVLFVGNLEPKKNIGRIIEAFNTLRKSRSIPHALAVVGRKEWLFKDLKRMVRLLGLERHVFFLGNVPLSDLVLLYNAADVFIFPSLYEGFGIPPLEAMACGTPVVTSNRSSLPEVVGDAAVTVDPLSTGEIAQALHAVLTGDELRRTLRERGLNRAKLFSWESTARKTMEVYGKVIAS